MKLSKNNETTGNNEECFVSNSRSPKANKTKKKLIQKTYITKVNNTKQHMNYIAVII